MPLSLPTAEYADDAARATVTTFLRGQYAQAAAEYATHTHNAEGLDQQVALAAAELIRVTGLRDAARGAADDAHRRAEAFRVALALNGAPGDLDDPGDIDDFVETPMFRPFVPTPEAGPSRWQSDVCPCGGLMAWDEARGFHHTEDGTPAAALCKRVGAP
ncbi:hypothetical protein ACFY19_20890 [Streptosporangium saharense]|uniref:hypothetical protein n=1 Tax=Streptosporangium saharense TaxID=1706840 RepID=UPI0036A2C345